MGGAGRSCRELSLSLPGLAGLLLLAMVLAPAGVGALLGAHQGRALRDAPRLARLPRLADAGPTAGRRSPYLVSARSRRPPAPPAPPPAPLAERVQELLARPLATPEHRRGHVRIYSLHLDELVDVVPFDAAGRRDEAAFAALSHLFRCRITGHEVPLDEELVRLLVALVDIYDEPLHLISGHRVAHTIGTSPTSQHTMGTAADVRVPGVPIDELREVAMQLGARGVGLYTHKRFVHIDFRDKREYFWSDVGDAAGEQSATAATANENADETGEEAGAGHANAATAAVDALEG
jgi:uncharacterized protein YcbK (DUF882 family)